MIYPAESSQLLPKQNHQEIFYQFEALAQQVLCILNYLKICVLSYEEETAQGLPLLCNIQKSKACFVVQKDH